MPNYTLSHSEIDDKGFFFGIHCSLEPFNLAFKINSLLKIKLIRTNHDVTFKNKKERYMVYKNIVKKNETPLWPVSYTHLRAHET